MLAWDSLASWFRGVGFSECITKENPEIPRHSTLATRYSVMTRAVTLVSGVRSNSVEPRRKFVDSGGIGNTRLGAQSRHVILPYSSRSSR